VARGEGSAALPVEENGRMKEEVESIGEGRGSRKGSTSFGG